MSLFAKLNTVNSNEKKDQFDYRSQLFSFFKKVDEMPEFVQDYLISRISLGYSHATIQRYIYDFRFFFQYVSRFAEEASFDSSKITLEDFSQLEQEGIKHYVSYLALEIENEPRTINRKLSALHSLFDYLLKSGIVTKNPVAGVERPKIGKREAVFLTQTEARQLLACIRTEPETNKRQQLYYTKLNNRDYVVFFLLITTGLRISELTSLKMNQIQFTRQTLSVIGKGNKARTIPLSPETLTVIEDYLHSLPEKVRPASGEDHLIIGYDFMTQRYTKSVTINALQKMIQRHLQRAEKHVEALQKKQMTAHKLRHTFATALIENGVDVLTVQSLLGHESVATTQVYAHVQDKAREEAIEKLSYVR